MRLFILAAALSFALVSVAQQVPEAPTGFDNKSNGVVDDATHQADQAKFEEVEGLADGLGPLYNAQSCRECHQNPTSGGPSIRTKALSRRSSALQCFAHRVVARAGWR